MATDQVRYVEIVEESEIIPWQYREAGVVFASEFQLRLIPGSLQRKWRKQFTKREWERGSRQDDLDYGKFNDECLDYAIVGWTGVRSKGADLPCERKYKLLLPEMIKAEITRLCLGKELGQAREDQEDQVEMVGGAEDEGSAEGEQSPRPSVGMATMVTGPVPLPPSLDPGRVIR